MKYILDYDLFIFDFDGTILDTETYHCNAWALALSEYKKKSIKIDLLTYQKYFHSLTNTTSRNYIKFSYGIDDYDEIYKIKQNYYKELISNNKILFINGFEDFLNYLIEHNKKIVVVSNTSKEFINIFLDMHPILNNIHRFYTKELFINRKPNPECYLRVSNEYKDLKKIGFEDSLIGLHALYQVNDITPVLIYDNEYYYRDFFKNNYNIISLSNFNKNELNNNLESYNINDSKVFINNILDNNIRELEKNKSNMNHAINQISILLNNINNSNHIYLTGMGKSGYVCKKSASTWQSLSINCSYIDLPNLPHGDFGIFRDGDVLILISNSGNTDELIYILDYIKTKLNKKITTVSIVANKDSSIEKISDFTYVLENINECDLINMAPSTSSLVFMALLDGIAVNMKKTITREEFQKYHPAGSLGKKGTHGSSGAQAHHVEPPVFRIQFRKEILG
jgi:D-arabinose 5-phosphate isomerase GutQ/beta-phosphoglucomutase-like phosphatase (HAD superfamily)